MIKQIGSAVLITAITYTSTFAAIKSNAIPTDLSPTDVKESLLKNPIYTLDSSDEDDVREKLTVSTRKDPLDPAVGQKYNYLIYTDSSYEPIFVDTFENFDDESAINRDPRYKKIYVYSDGINNKYTNDSFYLGRNSNTCFAWASNEQHCSAPDAEMTSPFLTVLGNIFYVPLSVLAILAPSGPMFHRVLNPVFNVRYYFEDLKSDLEGTETPSLIAELRQSNDYKSVNRRLAMKHFDEVEDDLIDDEGKVYIGDSNGLTKAIEFYYPESMLRVMGVTETEPRKKIQQFTQIMMDAYLTPKEPMDISSLIPSNISKPQMPSETKLVKGEFENKTQFKEREQKMKDDLNTLNNVYKEGYEEAVNYRNEFLKELQSVYEEDVKRIKEEQKAKESISDDKARTFKQLASYMAFQNLFVENLKYDAESENMYGYISDKERVFHEKIAIKVDQKYAKELKNSPLKASPLMTYSFAQGSMILEEMMVKYDGEEFITKLTDQNYKQEVMEVKISSRSVDTSGATQTKLAIQDTNFANATYLADDLNSQKSYASRGINFNKDLEKRVENEDQHDIDPHKWLFAVGIEDYGQADDVIFSKRSASLVAELFQKNLGIDKKQSVVMTDNQATSARIKAELNKMINKVAKGDTLYFYFSGHGLPDTKGNAYLLPQDMEVAQISDEKYFELNNLYKKLSSSKASKVVTIIDSCFSGKKPDSGKLMFKGVAGASYVHKSRNTYDPKKMTIITAGSDSEFSNAYDAKGHRLMSYYLIKGILDGENDISKLYTYIEKNVKQKSMEKGDVYKQTPQIQGKKNITL